MARHYYRRREMSTCSRSPINTAYESIGCGLTTACRDLLGWDVIGFRALFSGLKKACCLGLDLGLGLSLVGSRVHVCEDGSPHHHSTRSATPNANSRTFLSLPDIISLNFSAVITCAAHLRRADITAVYKTGLYFAGICRYITAQNFY